MYKCNGIVLTNRCQWRGQEKCPLHVKVNTICTGCIEAFGYAISGTRSDANCDICWQSPRNGFVSTFIMAK